MVSREVLSRLAEGDRVEVRFMEDWDCDFVVDKVCLDIGIVCLQMSDGNRAVCALKQIQMVYPAKMTEWHFEQLDAAMKWLDGVRRKTVRLDAEHRGLLEIKMKEFDPAPDIEERVERDIDQLVKREFQRGKVYGNIAAFLQSTMLYMERIINDGCVLYTPPEDLMSALATRWLVRTLRTGKYVSVDALMATDLVLSLIHI